MWPPPEPGDVVWCRFPERPRDKPGPRPRPGLVMTVTERADGIVVGIAYGTSQGLARLSSGEFAIRREANGAAYKLAGLSHDTRFDLRRVIDLPWDGAFFSVPPDARHGQAPKLGTLHPSMMKAVLAAAGREC